MVLCFYKAELNSQGEINEKCFISVALKKIWPWLKYQDDFLFDPHVD